MTLKTESVRTNEQLAQWLTVYTRKAIKPEQLEDDLLCGLIIEYLNREDNVFWVIGKQEMLEGDKTLVWYRASISRAFGAKGFVSDMCTTAPKALAQIYILYMHWWEFEGSLLKAEGLMK